MINSRNYPIFIGAIISQCVVLFTTYFVLSYSNPIVYGRFSYFISIVSILASISTLKFEQAIVVSSSEEEVKSKIWLTVILNLVITIIVLLSLSLVIDFSQFEIIMFLPLSFGIVMVANFQQFFLYKNLHRYNAFLSVSVSLINFSIIFFYISYDWGLTVAYSLSYFLVAIITMFFFINKKLLSIVSFKKIKKIFISNLNYVKYILPSSIVTILLTYFHPILLSFLYTDKSVGEFSLSLRVLMLPSVVFGGIVGGLLRTKLAQFKFLEDKRLFDREVSKTIKYLISSVFLFFPILLFLIYFCIEYLNFIQWSTIPYVSFFLVGYAISQYLFIPLINIPLVLDKGQVLLKCNVYIFITNLVVYLIAFILSLKFEAFILLLSIANLLLVGFQIFKFKKLELEK